MLGLFVSSTEGLLEELARALERKDATLAARQAHQIKGASSYLGAAEVTSLAAEAETRAKAGELDACRVALEDLEAAFISVRLEIDSL